MTRQGSSPGMLHTQQVKPHGVIVQSIETFLQPRNTNKQYQNHKDSIIGARRLGAQIAAMQCVILCNCVREGLQ
eukprot:jgi/Chrzof1/3682/Cz13g05010.t1